MTEMIPGLVSTIIPVKNRPVMLREAVESVLTQTYARIEIIICDDGSDDETMSVARELVRSHPDTIRVVRNPGRGAGRAREAGRLLARGEFIQYLDSDDLLMPRKFELQVGALREHPLCGAAYGFIKLQNSDGSFLPDPFKETAVVHETLFPRLLALRWWNTDCPLYRRAVTDAVGSWSDLPFSQDWEYDARVGALKTLLVHVPDWVCVQRNHGAVRQTGSGVWLSPSDRSRFFRTLYSCATAAGVDRGGPEMTEFSRWTFFHARYCGYMNDSKSASELLKIARSAVRKPSWDLRVYDALGKVLGFRMATYVVELLRGNRAADSFSGLRG